MPLVCCFVRATSQPFSGLCVEQAVAGSRIFQQLENAMATAVKLNEHIREVEAKLYTHPMFISKVGFGALLFLMIPKTAPPNVLLYMLLLRTDRGRRQPCYCARSDGSRRVRLLGQAGS